MSEYGKNQKRISFMDTDKRNADFLIKLKHDGLTKTKFFRAILSGYLEEDGLIGEFISTYKKKSGSQSKNKIKIVEKLREEATQVEKKFGLAEGEIESIFDILEKEHPDL
tara:strand:- start:80 stop:409 length:330 start_codon:yes stop_codon:yes gene_type:complete